MSAATKRAGKPEVIQVPKPARSSYNPGRLLDKNLLLKSQVEHFHHVNMQLPDQHRTDRKPEDIRTEGEASEFIRAVTARLHAMHGKKVKKAT